MGGPPLVSPNRVKVGGSVRNDDDDDDERDTWLVAMAPRPGIYNMMSHTSNPL